MMITQDAIYYACEGRTVSELNGVAMDMEQIRRKEGSEW